jgi:hypothetical protein
VKALLRSQLNDGFRTDQTIIDHAALVQAKASAAHERASAKTMAKQEVAPKPAAPPISDVELNPMPHFLLTGARARRIEFEA